MFDLFWVDFGETIFNPSHFRRSLLSEDCLNSEASFPKCGSQFRRSLLSEDCLNSVASFPKCGCGWKGLR